MSGETFRSSKPDHWTVPRPHRDASQRYMSYGPIRPMDEPGMVERWMQFFRRK